MNKLLFSLMLMSVMPAFAVNCVELNNIAEQKGAHYRPVLGKKVIQQGRLYFHVAPNPQCKTQVFIIQNDSVITYQNYRGYDYVMFMNEKTGNTATGWVKESSLKTTGTMGLTY